VIIVNKSDTLFRQRQFQKPSIQEEVNTELLLGKWKVYEEWEYSDNLLYNNNFPELAASDGVDDLCILYRNEEQKLDIDIHAKEICMDEEIRLDKYSKVDHVENHCYNYSIKDNHLHIEKDTGTEEWEIIRLDKKEFWYRNLDDADYKIYKCRRK